MKMLDHTSDVHNHGSSVDRSIIIIQYTNFVFIYYLLQYLIYEHHSQVFTSCSQQQQRLLGEAMKRIRSTERYSYLPIILLNIWVCVCDEFLISLYKNIMSQFNVTCSCYILMMTLKRGVLKPKFTYL